MRCSALTAKGEPCKSKAGSTGYCRRHGSTAIVPREASAAERQLREQMPFIVARVRVGSSPISAFGCSGYETHRARKILAIAAGGEPDVTDGGYRAACEDIASSLHAAQSERDGELAAAWRGMAMQDWRAAQAFLERRSPDEWTATQQVSVDATINTRSEDAVLEALKRVQGGAIEAGASDDADA